MASLVRCAILAGTALAAGACVGAGSAPSPVRLGPALAAMVETADRIQAPWRCSGAREHAANVAFAGWDLRAGVLRNTAAESKRMAIGFVADAAGNAPTTMASLARLRHAFEAANVNLVVMLGGMGSTQTELNATVGALVGPWPIVALPGDLEPMSAHTAAIESLRQRGATVIDGRGVWTIDLPNARVAVLPGVGSAYRTVAGRDGCVWAATDVAESYRELSPFPGLRIAVSAEAPRGVVDGDATGESALVPPVPIDLVVHGAAGDPSPDARGERSGANVRLSPGSADATTRLPPSNRSSGALLIIANRTWEWRALVDSPPPPRVESREARGSAPAIAVTR